MRSREGAICMKSSAFRPFSFMALTKPEFRFYTASITEEQYDQAVSEITGEANA